MTAREGSSQPLRAGRGDLRLRPPRQDDEAAFLAAHAAMERDGFDFALGYEQRMSWSTYLDRLRAHRLGRDLAPGFVPATFLVAVVDGEIVGRASIRHELNDFLAREGGHIGYCVVAEHRAGAGTAPRSSIRAW